MTHYSNFIILIVQLVLVHSDSNYIYQKLLTTTIRAEVPHVVHHVPVNKNPIVSYSNAFFEPRTTTITTRNEFLRFDKYSNERCFH